jgi:hypothetical protein
MYHPYFILSITTYNLYITTNYCKLKIHSTATCNLHTL